MTYGDYPDLSNVKRILVVKLRQLGDVLLTGPVFTTLKERFPEAKIDAYVYSESEPLLKGHPALSQILTYNRGWKKLFFFSRIAKEIQILWTIRKKSYDLVINLTEGDRGALAAKFSRAPIRVGFDPKGSGLFGKKKLYTHIAKNCSSLRHTVERNLDAVRRLGIFPTWEQRELFLPIPHFALIKMRAAISGPFILIHPTSRWRFKCLPVKTMRALASELLSQGHRLVFTSGPDPDERKMIDEITHGLDILNLSGKITLEELSALVFLSEQLICVDSLPFHMANALKKPVLAIFGPTSEITWGPWRNPEAQIVAQAFSCRPCYQDGCGGSKLSDCLATLPLSQIMAGLNKKRELLYKVRSGVLHNSYQDF